jgi:hypothetical protein
MLIIVLGEQTIYLGTDKSNRQKIIKDIEDLNNTINQQDIIGIHGKFDPITAEYILFQAPRKHSQR